MVIVRDVQSDETLDKLAGGLKLKSTTSASQHGVNMHSETTPSKPVTSSGTSMMTGTNGGSTTPISTGTSTIGDATTVVTSSDGAVLSGGAAMSPVITGSGNEASSMAADVQGTTASPLVVTMAEGVTTAPTSIADGVTSVGTSVATVSTTMSSSSSKTNSSKVVETKSSKVTETKVMRTFPNVTEVTTQKARTTVDLDYEEPTRKMSEF